MHHFGVELHAVEALRIIGNCREGRAFTCGHNPETLRQPVNMVTMAHPYLFAVTHGPDAVKQRTGFFHVNKGATKFLMVGRSHATAKFRDHCLLAVTYAQDRDTHFVDTLWRAGGIGMRNACRAAAQDNTRGVKAIEHINSFVERDDFTVNPGFAHTTRDQLGYL